MDFMRKKWFWLGMIVVLVVSLIFDFVVLNIWAIHSIITGSWDIHFTAVGIGLIISDTIGSLSKKWKIAISPFTRLIFFVLIILAISADGFWMGILLMSTILILSRLVRIIIWFMKRMIRKFRRRGLLEEI